MVNLFLKLLMKDRQYSGSAMGRTRRKPSCRWAMQVKAPERRWRICCSEPPAPAGSWPPHIKGCRFQFLIAAASFVFPDDMLFPLVPGNKNPSTAAMAMVQ